MEDGSSEGGLGWPDNEDLANSPGRRKKSPRGVSQPVVVSIHDLEHHKNIVGMKLPGQHGYKYHVEPDDTQNG